MRCFAYQDGNEAMVATMRMTYLRNLYICYVKSTVSETLPSCLYKNDINGGANHIGLSHLIRVPPYAYPWT